MALDEKTVDNNDLELNPGQDLVLFDSDGKEVLRFDASSGLVVFRSAAGEQVGRLAGRQGNLLLGGEGIDGDLLLFASDASVTNPANAASIRMNGQLAQVSVGIDSIPGAVEVRGPTHHLRLDGSSGRLEITGKFEIRSSDGGTRMRITPDAAMFLGGDSQSGSLRLLNGSGEVTLHLNADTGNLAVGGADEAGILSVKAGTGSNSDNAFVLDGERGDVILGRKDRGADISVRDDEGLETLLLRGKNGNIAAGRSGKASNIFVKNSSGQNSIHLSGETGNINVDGDIRLSNADCAEEFPVFAGTNVAPGTVVVLCDDGSIKPSDRARDARVAGVVSGAGPLRPGIILDSQGERGRAPVALSGKVYCNVDARHTPIRVGDLLTSSELPGHAMKATPGTEVRGAVIGKAMEPLASGCGLIRVLVCLA